MYQLVVNTYNRWETIRQLWYTRLPQQPENSVESLINLTAFEHNRNEAIEWLYRDRLAFYKLLKNLGFDIVKIRKSTCYTISRVEDGKRKDYFLDAK